MEGTVTLVLISSSTPNDRVSQHGNAIRAAVEAGVEHIIDTSVLIYTSVLKADSSMSIMCEEHLATEKLIQASGLNYTILRNAILC